VAIINIQICGTGDSSYTLKAGFSQAFKVYSLSLKHTCPGKQKIRQT